MMNSLGSTANSNPSFVIIALAQLTISLLFSILFYKWKIESVSSGFFNGAWIMFLIMLWFDLWMLTTFNFMTPSLFLVDVVSNTAFGALAGGVIAFIQGKVGSKNFTSISQPA